MTTIRNTAEQILSLRAAGTDRFIGDSHDVNHFGSVYGGRLIAQALAAATRTVDALSATSLHSYFLSATTTSAPLEYYVDRLRDSRRFANRQVTVYQDGRRVFTLLCQFHAPEDGFEHQAVIMPAVPPPDDVATLQEFVRANGAYLDEAVIHNFSGLLPVEVRPINPAGYFLQQACAPTRDFWFRLPSADAVDDPRLQQCLLAYASDYWLGAVSAIPHALPTNSKRLLIASLDHAVWFHRPVRCNEWLFYQTGSPSAQDGLGLAQGSIFDRSGRLVATTAQEGLMRRLGVPEAEKSVSQPPAA